jgi:hypothetical protein
MAFDPTSVPVDPPAAPLAPDRVADLLASATEIVAAELTALGDELAGWRPAPGEWSANECVGHLIEADRRGFAGRISRILAENGVAEPGWDQLAVAVQRRDDRRPVADVLAEWRAGRVEAVALVRSLGPSDLSRHADHAAVGRLTVGELLEEWVFHDRNHIRQLLANAQARVWPAMGNTRRFTAID